MRSLIPSSSIHNSRIGAAPTKLLTAATVRTTVPVPSALILRRNVLSAIPIPTAQSRSGSIQHCPWLSQHSVRSLVLDTLLPQQQQRRRQRQHRYLLSPILRTGTATTTTTTTNRTMKVFSLSSSSGCVWWLLGASSINIMHRHCRVKALPFRTRGTSGSASSNDNNKSDDDSEATATTMADGIVFDDHSTEYMIQVQPHTSPSRRNAVVETYFQQQYQTDNDMLNAASEALTFEIREQATNLTDFLVQTRRTLHVRPELMYQEEETSAVVQHVLNQLEIPFSTGWGINTNPDRFPGRGGYGIVADIGTGQEPCILLRADMDALPIQERTAGIDSYLSRHDGRMHACGHDGHTTMLLGAAAILKGMESSLNGTVRLMFQPAEEGGAGGKRMREEGILQLPPQPSYAFGMHVWPTLPSGTIATRPGPLLAAAERFEILVAGVGGHAAMPHQTIDPIVAASAMVMNLQTIVSRNQSPLDSGVCSITKFEAGEAYNIIPAAAILRGTVRALTTETLLFLRDKVQHIVEQTAAVYGCNVTITYSPDYYPPTVNDPVLYETFSKHVAATVSVEGTVRDTDPTMGAEDFSFVAESIPSTFFLLGQGSGHDPPTNYGLHHPHFALDENVLSRGAELHVQLAVRALHQLRLQQEERAFQ